MSRHLTRRVAVLERRVAPPAAPALAPCLVLAEDAAAAEREVERILAAHPNARRALFVMTRGRREPGRAAVGSA
jgi:hypothetical protein